jgi:hypothetical protein
MSEEKSDSKGLKNFDKDMKIIVDGMKYIETNSREFNIRRKVRVLLPILIKIREELNNECS